MTKNLITEIVSKLCAAIYESLDLGWQRTDKIPSECPAAYPIMIQASGRRCLTRLDCWKTCLRKLTGH
uniref:Prophage protein n=1 Tax=Steinernema glaseri TaxID=37863 RepID=A0A1I8A7S1_9BILA